MPTKNYADCVFINCPFDEDYQPFFQALYFAIVDCGFHVRCSLEIDDGSEVRVEKILRIIRDSKFSIHDISRTELDAANNLPRFNMPLELGMFLAAKRFGGSQQKRKACLILDHQPYRYQKFLSDISGQDIKSHDNDVEKLIRAVRDWLRSVSRRSRIPGGKAISGRFNDFLLELPHLCRQLDVEPDELTYADYGNVVSIWLKANT